MKRILVLCTGNSARSQMGEGLFRYEGRGAYEVESAGTNPSHVRPEAIAVMKEIGIDISGAPFQIGERVRRPEVRLCRYGLRPGAR